MVSLHLLLPDDLARGLPRVDRSLGDFRQLAGRRRSRSGPIVGRTRSCSPRSWRSASGTASSTSSAAGWRTPRSGRTSLFLHVELPHQPYHFLPSGQRYPDALGELPGLGADWTRNRWLARQGFQRYLLQVGYADRLLGEAIERLRSSGRYDRSLIVVMADHGASFLPGESYRAATEGNLPQVASIPLLIKAPGQKRPRVDDANVHSIDVLPTIAARLGVRDRWDLAGRPASRRRPLGKVFVQPQNWADEVTMPFPEFVRRRDARVNGMLADFGTAPSGLYGVGPDGDLSGRPVSELAPPTTGEGRFELDAGGLLASVDPRGSVVPSFITGRVTDVAPRARLAIAVNGRVAATTVSYADDGLRRFAAIVSPSAFVRGRNTVEVIAVTGTGAGRRLERLRGSALGYRLVRDGGRETIVDSSGRRFPITASAVQGFIDDQTLAGADLSIRGWAGTTEPARAADRVVVFVGGEFTAAGRPSVARDDLGRKYGRGLARAGFELRGGVVDLGNGAKRPPVRAFALAGGHASQLAGPGAPFSGPSAPLAPRAQGRDGGDETARERPASARRARRRAASRRRSSWPAAAPVSSARASPRRSRAADDRPSAPPPRRGAPPPRRDAATPRGRTAARRRPAGPNAPRSGSRAPPATTRSDPRVAGAQAELHVLAV